MNHQEEAEFLKNYADNALFSLTDVYELLESSLKQLEAGDQELARRELESAIGRFDHCFEDIDIIEGHIMHLEGRKHDPVKHLEEYMAGD